jgi:hypothetical protein
VIRERGDWGNGGNRERKGYIGSEVNKKREVGKERCTGEKKE